MLVLDPDQLLGQTIGRYTLERFLGQGGSSWVFHGRRADDQQLMALKVLKPSFAADPKFVSRFRNETEVASKLEHPNIVPVTEVGEADGLIYYAMDAYPESLAARLDRTGPLPEPELARIASEIGGALAFLHAAGLIHRDVKVGNIFLASDERAVLADFGLARATSARPSATGVNMAVGTPHYFSPEQAQGRPLDGRSDLYALGVTLYRAATGQLPFQANDWFQLARMLVEDPPTPPRNLRSDLSPGMERVILRCLAKHPDDRFPTAEDMVRAIKESD